MIISSKIKVGLYEFEIMCEFTSVMQGKHCFKITAPKGFENVRIKVTDASEMTVMREAFDIISNHPQLPYKKWTEDYKGKKEPIVYLTGLDEPKPEMIKIPKPAITLLSEELEANAQHTASIRARSYVDNVVDYPDLLEPTMWTFWKRVQEIMEEKDLG